MYYKFVSPQWQPLRLVQKSKHKPLGASVIVSSASKSSELISVEKHFASGQIDFKMDAGPGFVGIKFCQVSNL